MNDFIKRQTDLVSKHLPMAYQPWREVSLCQFMSIYDLVNIQQDSQAQWLWAVILHWLKCILHSFTVNNASFSSATVVVELDLYVFLLRTMTVTINTIRSSWRLLLMTWQQDWVLLLYFGTSVSVAWLWRVYLGTDDDQILSETHWSVVSPSLSKELQVCVKIGLLNTFKKI